MVLSGETGAFPAILRQSSSPRWFVYSINLFSFLCGYHLAVDGWAARRFNQQTKFGAWLDVIIDNIGRGILWTNISSVRRKRTNFDWRNEFRLDRNRDLLNRMDDIRCIEQPWIELEIQTRLDE